MGFFLEVSPVTPQPGVCVEARFETIVRLDACEMFDETEQTLAVERVDWRSGHPAVDPFDDEGDPVTVVVHPDQLRCGNAIVERPEHLAFAPMHSRRDRIQVQSGRLDEHGTSIGEVAASSRTRREPASEVRGSVDRGTRDLVHRTANMLGHHRPRRTNTLPIHRPIEPQPGTATAQGFRITCATYRRQDDATTSSDVGPRIRFSCLPARRAIKASLVRGRPLAYCTTNPTARRRSGSS